MEVPVTGISSPARKKASGEGAGCAALTRFKPHGLLRAERGSGGLYSNPAAYESYMGRWNMTLAPAFLRFACSREPSALLDIGCRTGSLLRAAAASFPQARLVGVDAVPDYLVRLSSSPAWWSRCLSPTGSSTVAYPCSCSRRSASGDQRFTRCTA